MSAATDVAARHAGKQSVSIGYMRHGDARKPATVRLMVQDENMDIVVLLDLDPKEFTDVLSGLNTWVVNPLDKRNQR